MQGFFDSPQLSDHVKRWRDLLTDRSKLGSQEMAYEMVRVVGSEHFEQWYESSGDKYDPDFSEAFDIAAELETPDGSDAQRAALLRRLQDLIKVLADRYLVVG